jgi:guanylate kinase
MMPRVQRERGILVIVSSPSGAGKTTLTHRLLAEFGAQLEFSVSYTTRPRRAGEVDGKDYHFVSPEVFEQMIEHRAFAEHAFVHGNRYGTALAPIEAALSSGRDIIFDVDWQGGAALSAHWPEDSLKIFILPVSLERLAFQLNKRATDAPGVIERRLQKALDELQHYVEYQHLIVNDQLDQAYAELRAIYLTRRYGVVDRHDIAHPLADLAKLLHDERAALAAAHARKLIAR